jgi:hypothetical protein
MRKLDRLSFELERGENRKPGDVRWPLSLASLLAATALAPSVLGSENVPHRPFAMWADVPDAGQFVAGIVYEESEAYHIYVKGNSRNITYRSPDGESYGIDINQGYIALQYGLTERWALDLNVGATTVGWRSFSQGNATESTTGLMDSSFGVRYQIFKEAKDESPWLPTLTARAGAILPGSFNEGFAFSPGLRSAAIEPEMLARKHFGWPGLGAYADCLYRWNRTTGNDQYITTIGLFQQIKGWELDAGYRHLQTISGTDITFGNPNDLTTLQYPRDPREISDAIEAGFSYTTSKRHFRYGFHSRTIFDGNNTDRKFWVGGSLDVPFGGKKAD